MRPITTPPTAGPVSVSELIDETAACWREELVCDTFLPMDASVIRNIPLCTRHTPDFWSWSKEKGRFTVSSTYRMLVQTKFTWCSWLEKVTGSSSNEQKSKDWVALWGTQVPAKLKIFLWRLALHSLPTNDVRAHRKMADNSKCNLCGMEDSWKHALLECSMSWYI